VSYIDLICTADRAPLALSGQSYRCPDCGAGYALDNGVIRFLAEDDRFYEGAYQNQVRFLPRSESPRHVWPLWLIANGYPWAVRRHVPAGRTVVELGCAGGVRYLGSRYRMIGCDLSFSSLLKLDAVYQMKLQADAADCLPLADNSVDAVVSSYFWEHIAPEVKPRILKELQRILRPGGKLVFLYDVETKNPLIERYKLRDPALYRRLFIEGDGHLGYQTPAENLAAFVSSGFRVVERRGMEKTWLQSPSTYGKLSLFGTAAGRLLARAARLGQPPYFYPFTALLRMVDTVAGKLLPHDWARIDLVVLAKID
jgi:SAM-dependent methyltransferase